MALSVRTTKGSFSEGLLNLSRNYTTVDALGASCAANKSRFDRPGCLVGPPVDTPVAIVDRGAGGSARVMGYDNATMMVLSQQSGAANPRVEIITTAPGDEENAVEGVTKKTWTLQTANNNFQPVNDYDGAGDATKAYQIGNGGSGHRANGGVRGNLIVVSGHVVTGIGTTPANGGFWIGYSTDRGQTFSILEENSNGSSVRGLLTGTNLVSGPFLTPPDANGDEWCFFGVTDYVTGGGASTQGFEAWIVGAKKQADGTWGTPAKLAVLNRPAAYNGHCHGVAVLVKNDASGVPTLIVLADIGDLQPRTVLLARTVPLHQWNVGADDSTITDADDAQTQWNGVTAAYGGGHASDNTLRAAGAQVVGFCPADPLSRAVLVGADEIKFGAVIRYDAEDFDLSTGVFSRTQPVLRLSSGQNSNVNSFYIAPDPNIGSGFVTAAIDDRASSNADEPLYGYSPDGVHWGYGHTGDAAVRDAYVYTSSETSGQLTRRARPAAIAGRPLLLGQGGNNYAKADFEDDVTTPTVAPTTLTRAQAAALVPVAPPSMAQNFLRFTYAGGSQGAADDLIAVYNACNGTQADADWRARFDVCNVSQYGSTLCGQLRSANPYLNIGADLFDTNVRGEWGSRFVVQNYASAPNTIRVRTAFPANTSAARTDNAADVIFSLGDLRPVTEGVPGPPLPPETTGADDETIALPLADLGGAAWTIRLAKALPAANWDRHFSGLPNQSAGQAGVEIARIEWDADNFLVIGLRCATSIVGGEEIVVTGEIGGVAITRLGLSVAGARAVRGASIIVALSYNGTTLAGEGFVNQLRATGATVSMSAPPVSAPILREPPSDYYETATWGISTDDTADAAGDTLAFGAASLPFEIETGPRSRNFRARAGGYVR